MTALELLKQYLDSFFVEHKPEKILTIITDDIHSYGLAEQRAVKNIGDAKNLLVSEAYKQFLDFELEILCEDAISDESASVVYTLTHNKITVKYRLTGCARKTDDGEKLYLLHSSTVDPDYKLTHFSELSRKKQEEAAKEVLHISDVNDLQMQALDQNETGVCIIDAETNELYYANSAAFTLHGAEMCDYSGKTCCEAFYGDGKSCDNCWRNNLVDGEGHAIANCRGRILSVTSESRSWKGHRVVVVYQRDITKQYKLSQELEDSNRELSRLLGNMSCGLCVSTIDDNKKFSIKYISDGFCELFDGNKEELLHRHNANPTQGLDPDDVKEVSEFMKKCSEGAFTGEITYRYTTIKNKSMWLTMKIKVIPDEYGGLVSYATYFDVTERMDNQKKLSDVIHNVPGGVCMYRWDGKEMEHIVISEQAAKLLGQKIDSDTDLKTISCLDNVYPEDEKQLRSLIHEMVTRTGETVSGSYRILTENRKDYHWVQLTGVGTRQDDGQIMLYVNYADIDTAKRNEQRILQEEETLESVCDFANIWSWVYEVKYDRIHCFRKLKNDFGMPEYLEDYPESWLSMGFIMPEYVELHRQKVMAIKNGSDHEEFDVRIKNPNGEINWSRMSFNRTSRNGSDVICTARLVDDEKYLEARIEVEEKQQAEGGANLLAHCVTNVTKNIPVEHKYSFDERPELQKWESLEKQLELTQKYIVSSSKKDKFLSMHQSDYLRGLFAKGISSDSLEYRRLLPDGRIIWVRNVIHLVQDPKTGDILNYEYVFNIHQHKISEELMNAVVSFGYEICASLMVDSNQVTILRSENLQKKNDLEVVSYTDTNLAYANRFIVDEDRQMYLDACSPENISEQLKTKDHFEITHRTLENGKIHYKKDQCYGYSEHRTTCLLIRSDITDIVLAERGKQAELEKALREAEAATVAKSEFLSRMSHEIRTPMNAIMGMTAIAKESKTDYNQVSECLDKIDMSSHFLLTLINDILEMSRIESGRTEIKNTEFSFDFLIKSIKTVVEPLAMKSGIRYEYINNFPTDSHYQGDAMRIQQVLVNIITNAIKFTKPDGRVRFSVNVDEVTDDVAFFRFVIADTGIGMTEEFMKRMFKPFTQEDSGRTSQFGGSGLGLAISKSLVEAMKGSISVDSFKNVGSTFTVKLPIKRLHNISHTDDEKTFGKEDFSSLRGKNVLMAEDHPLNVMVARKLLERCGVSVTVAENGKIAVELFERSKIGEYDAILMDIRMPVMDGLDAAREIRALNRKDALFVPIIAMTANALEEDRENTKAAGMNAHLAKPFEPEQLYSVLCQQIGKAEEQ